MPDLSVGYFFLPFYHQTTPRFRSLYYGRHFRCVSPNFELKILNRHREELHPAAVQVGKAIKCNDVAIFLLKLLSIQLPT
jgi:hypothetical protein